MLTNYKISLNENIDIDCDTLTGTGNFTVYDTDTNELYCYLIVNLEGIRSIYVIYNDDELTIKRFALTTTYVFNDDKTEFFSFLNNHLQTTHKIKCTGMKINYRNKSESLPPISSSNKKYCNIL